MISVIFALLSHPVFAQEPSAFEQALAQESRAKSRESWLEIKGVYYRRVEVNNQVYFLRFRREEPNSMDVYCEPPDNLKIAHESDAETFRRSPAYVGILHDTCHVENKHMIYRIPLDNQAGFEFMDPPKVGAKKAKP